MDPMTLEGQFTTRSRNVGQQAPSSGVQYVFRKNEDLNGTAWKAWKLVQTRLITCREVTVFGVTNRVLVLVQFRDCGSLVFFPDMYSFFDMDMSYTRVLHIKVAYRVPHK
jgi:hypothetical protein